MSGTFALVWFITTTVVVFGMLTLGTYLAAHSYEPHRGGIHLRHRH
jgi:hypothetical protein